MNYLYGAKPCPAGQLLSAHMQITTLASKHMRTLKTVYIPLFK